MYRLLIVDDEPLVQIGLKSMLAKELADKIEVVGTASNGQEAWDIISENPPDIVIADIRMPVMTGLELHRMLPRYSIRHRRTHQGRSPEIWPISRGSP